MNCLDHHSIPEAGKVTETFCRAAPQTIRRTGGPACTLADDRIVPDNRPSPAPDALSACLQRASSRRASKVRVPARHASTTGRSVSSDGSRPRPHCRIGASGASVRGSAAAKARSTSSLAVRAASARAAATLPLNSAEIAAEG